MTDLEVRRRRLTLSYLAVIMAMSLLFSAILYGVMLAQLNRPMEPREYGFGDRKIVVDGTLDWLDERDHQVRSSILLSLGALNLAVLGGGTIISYILARRTLHPIESAMESQRQFVSDASHELRTPLTALQAINEVALRKKQFDETKAREVLEKNIAEVGKMQSLTETLLTLTRTENKPTAHERFWLDETMADVISTMESVANKKGITLQSEIAHVELESDALVLGQIMTILIDNAIKYSPESSEVTVVTTEQKHGITLEVQDKGLGIEPKDQPYIFDRFYRADTARTRTATSGHGLGLAIAQSLCKRYGFELTLKKSSPKTGSIFALHVPRSVVKW